MSDDRIECPFVPDWWADRPDTAPGERPFVVWSTDDDVEPYRIAHNRDLMMDGDDLAQDYNFIDYCFGDPIESITARHYLGSREVSIATPGPADRTLAQAAAAVPAPVLRYLQRRFSEVKVLTAAGYVTLWAGPDA